jgi:hypothetical protein
MNEGGEVFDPHIIGAIISLTLALVVLFLLVAALMADRERKR